MFRGGSVVVRLALIHRFLTNNVFPDPNKLEARVSPGLKDDKWKTENQWLCSRECHHKFVAMKDVDHYICSLKPYIPEEMLREECFIPPSVRANRICTRCSAVDHGCSQQVLLDYLQLEKLINIKSSKNGLLNILLDYTPDTQSFPFTIRL